MQLLFNRQCVAAFKFYAQVLGGKIDGMMTNGASPMAEHVSPAWCDKIIHARLTVGDVVVMGSEAPPERYEQPKGFSVALGVKDPAEAEPILQALAEDGSVQMPLQKTSCPCVLAWLRGIPWMIDCEQAA
jgi:PhnB protein